MRRKKRTARPKRTKVTATPLPSSGKEALWKRLLRATPVILFLILLTFVFNRLGVMHRLEMVVLDAQMLLNTPSESIVKIVDITDDDYHDRELFDGQSPLNPEKLEALIRAIAEGQPAVIGVDIDTSSQKFKDLNVNSLCPKELRDENKCPCIIWERELFFPEDLNEKPEPVDVLGRYNSNLNDQSGVAVLIDDAEDKVTRRYTRSIATKDEPLPTFGFAVAYNYKSLKCERAVDSYVDPMFIKYRGNEKGSHRDRFTASMALANSRSQEWEAKIKGKIVLLGGSYLDQDRHYTPLGTMVGVDVLANVVETELEGGGPKPIRKFAIYLLEFFDSFLIILLFQIFPFRKALLLSLALLIPIAIICSSISLGSPWRFSYFAVLMVGVLIYELQQHYREKALMRVYQNLRGASPATAHEKVAHQSAGNAITEPSQKE